jgi:hypothetical protein
VVARAALGECTWACLCLQMRYFPPLAWQLSHAQSFPATVSAACIFALLPVSLPDSLLWQQGRGAAASQQVCHLFNSFNIMYPCLCACRSA